MKKIGFIGLGNMAGSIARGIIDSGFLSAKEMIAYDINDLVLQKMQDTNMEFAKGIEEIIEKSEFVFIGVKPQVVEEVLRPYVEMLKGKAVISIVLG